MHQIKITGPMRFSGSMLHPELFRLEWGEGYEGKLEISCPYPAILTGWVRRGQRVVMSLPGSITIISDGVDRDERRL